jgi:hypothetical protein
MIELVVLGVLLYLFILVYAAVKDKGYNTISAILAMIVSILASPLIVLLFCMYILPSKTN